MIRLRRRHLLAGGLAVPFTARAQPVWPADRPIGFIVPFPPGGGTDVNIRAMVPYLERHLPGARFVVLNRPGAGAEIGYTAVAGAAPDGYILGVVISPSLQTITIERTPRYRLEDLAYIGGIVEDPGGFFVAPSSPLRSLSDLAARARTKPGEIAVGTAGIGSDDHLLMLAFERAAGVRMLHVPFAGQAPTMAALLGGHIAIAAMNIGESMELVQQGQVRPLGQAATSRVAMAPAIPTFREGGFDILGGVVRGVALPAATPNPIRARLEAALAAVMRDPEWVAEAARLYIPLRWRTGAEMAEHVQQEAVALRRLWEQRPWKDSYPGSFMTLDAGAGRAVVALALVVLTRVTDAGPEGR